MAKRRKPPAYDSIEQMVAQAAAVIRPPDRLSVTEAAERHRWIDNPGNYIGPYKRELAPYMDEPQRELSSQEFTAMVFVGPAQCGKTEALPNWITHSAIYDPADMMIVAPTNTAARDFSKRRLLRLYRDTAELKKMLLPGRNSQNVFDTQFRNGMLLTLAHPSGAELAGKPIPRLWLTDYDRMPEDVDGEGSPFDLARKRATTFRRFGMCVAESSPSYTVEQPKWIASTPHEAPPTKGILSLYNRGDRRRWYWKCPHCEEAFEPEFKYLQYPDEGDDLYRAEHAVMICPRCFGEITHDMKKNLNINGRWIKDGMKWNKDGTITGRPYRSNIASFWLKGVAAAFADWKVLVINFLKASEEYEKTGSEEALKTTVNTDQGDPYISKATMSERLPEELKARAEDWGGTAKEPVVPPWVRYLIATVDVQAGMKSAFVVQVHGFSPGNDATIIDMFKIRKSKRTDDDGDVEMIDPAAYPEDWDVLIDQVLERSYPLSDGSPRRMQIKLVGCDSGGKEGVTTNAYNFWRRLRDDPDGRQYHKRFQLLKGEPSKTAQRYKIAYPDSQRRDRKAGARGDIPVGFINSNTQKDTVHAMLGRTDPGGGMVRFPVWAEDWLYMQLTAEARTPKGWVSTSNKRNEAWDLLYYAVSLLIDPRIQGEKMDWDDPPGWAAEWDKNDLIVEGDGSGGFVMRGKKSRRKSLRELGGRLG